MKRRFTVVVSALALGVLATVANAFILPGAVGVADDLAVKAAALHNHVHALYPGAISGATVHELDNAADKLHEDLFGWSLGLKPESAVLARLKTLKKTWARYNLTVKLEKLYAGDPVGRKMHDKCAKLFLTVDMMITGLKPR